MTEGQIDAFLTAAAAVIGAPAYQTKPAAHKKLKAAPEPAETPEPEVLATAMQLIPNDGPADWEHWNAIGMALFAATNGSEAGRDLWLAWSAKHPSYDTATTDARWCHYATSPPSRTGAGKLFALAADTIKAPTGGNSQHPPATHIPAEPDDPDAPPIERPVRFSDNALAFLFTAEYGQDLRYVPDWRTWLRWKGGREGNIAVAVMPKRGQAIATAINKATTIAAIERLARHHAPHVRTAAHFDTDTGILSAGTTAVGEPLPGAPTGVFDVTSILRPSVREDLTKQVTVTPANGDCPVWRGFLARIMGNDQAMTAYLRRVCGADEAMRRRMHLIPFEVTIPEAERDKALPDKLRKEYPQILTWMIQGRLTWQRSGCRRLSA